MAVTYEPIATQTLTTNTGIVTFSSIPQTYTDLVLRVSAQASSSWDVIAIRMNGTTSGYSFTYIQGDGASALAGRGSAEIAMRGGHIPGSSTSTYSTDEYNFMNYTGSTNYKTIISKVGSYNTGAQGFNIQGRAQLLQMTAAITSITIQTFNGANLTPGSTFTLYGIKAA
jgi:hypothetical protein